MKKTLFTLIFLIVIFQANAQENRIGNYGFKLGLTASPNFGFGKVDEGKANGLALGFSYGLIGDFNFAENYSFSTGLMVTSINAKVTKLGPSVSYSSSTPSTTLVEWDYKYKMQYIEIPLTVKLKTSVINGVRWFGQFGLSNGVAISSKIDLEVKENNSINFKDAERSKNTNAYRAALLIGGGGEFTLSGKTSLLLGLTLNNGFTNLSSIDGEKMRNHYTGINFGVFF
jgi:hypothetical protein